MPKPFFISSPEEIKSAKTTDVYFVRTLEILKAKHLDTQKGYAEFTVGELPGHWPWACFCGLEEVVSLLEGIPVDLKALPEGTLFPARDQAGIRVPAMAVEGAYGSYCLYETPLLGLICQATGVATKAARLRQRVQKAQILSFGVRRMHPGIAPMLDRASYMGGADAVSSLVGAQAIGMEPRGTMPHALIVAFGEAKAAWKAFDELMPASVARVALIDTYSDEKAEALLAAQVLKGRLEAVRLDTPGSRRGNLADLVREVRWELDLRGFKKVKIIVSGGIDEGEIPPLVAAGVDGFGIGTAISNAPTVDFAMDLVEMEGRPCAKRGKLGGKKMPWACPRCLGYRVQVAREKAPSCATCHVKMKPMFHTFLQSGRRVGTLPKISVIRQQVLDQLKKVGKQERMNA